MTMGNYNAPEEINNLLRKGTMIGNSMSQRNREIIEYAQQVNKNQAHDYMNAMEMQGPQLAEHTTRER